MTYSIADGPMKQHTDVFDTVFIVVGGRRTELTPDEFFALPLSERIAHVIQRTVTFVKDGREVDRHLVLARLRGRAVGAIAANRKN